MLIPVVQIKYNKRDITADVSRYLVSINYSDKVAGESDEIEINLEDTDGLWSGDWYPAKNDTLQVWFGYKDNTVYAGSFKIDEIEVSGPPDMVRLRGVAAGTDKAIRTKKSKAHEGKSLREIAQDIASQHGLTVDDGSGSFATTVNLSEEKRVLRIHKQLIDTNINTATARGMAIVFVKPLSTQATALTNKGFPAEGSKLKLAVDLVMSQFAKTTDSQGEVVLRRMIRNFSSIIGMMNERLPSNDLPRTITKKGVLDGLRTERTTQNRETDLAFLKRICADFGIVFSIRDTSLIFTSMYDLEGATPVTVISRTDLKSYSIKDKAIGIPKKAVVKYYNPKTDEVSEGEYKPEKQEVDGESFEAVTSEDVLEIRTKAESKQQAEAKARAALHSLVSKEVEGRLALIGNPLLVAGNNFTLNNMGGVSGIYHITQSVHSIDRGGYTTEITFKRVGYVAKKKRKKSS